MLYEFGLNVYNFLVHLIYISIITLTDMQSLYDYTNHVIMLLCWWVVWLKDNKELELELAITGNSVFDYYNQIKMFSLYIIYCNTIAMKKKDIFSLIDST